MDAEPKRRGQCARGCDEAELRARRCGANGSIQRVIVTLRIQLAVITVMVMVMVTRRAKLAKWKRDQGLRIRSHPLSLSLKRAHNQHNLCASGAQVFCFCGSQGWMQALTSTTHPRGIHAYQIAQQAGEGWSAPRRAWPVDLIKITLAVNGAVY